jgi:undecaprenyl-diphosphatase
VLTAAVGATLLDDLLKHLIGRTRPNFHPLAHAPGSAFPSGHATAAAAFYGALAYILTRGRSPRAAGLIWIGAAAVILAVAASRVYLGVHWPTDVIGGVLVGASWTAATVTATSVLAYRQKADSRTSIGSEVTQPGRTDA